MEGVEALDITILISPALLREAIVVEDLAEATARQAHAVAYAATMKRAEELRSEPRDYGKPND